MYEDGLVSAGQASEIVGISKRSFIEFLGKCGVSLFSQSKDDPEKDIANVITDTSCLIALSNIGETSLLRELYGAVYITEEIALEFNEEIPERIKMSGKGRKPL